MSLTTLTIFGGILAVLVVLAGMLVARAGPVGTAGQRLFFFLITAGVLLFLTVVLTPLLPARANRPGSPAVYLLAGASLGIITLTLLNLKLLKGMKVTERRLAVVLLAVLGLLFFLTGRDNSGILIWLIPLALLLLVGWSIRSWKLLPAAAGLVLLALLGLEPLTGLLTRLGEPLNLPAGYFIFTLTGLAPVLAAAAISGGLARLATGEAGSTQEKRAARLQAVLWIVPGLLLPAALAYKIYWDSIWDQTSDGLAGLFYSMLAGLAGIAAGMLMAAGGSGPRRKAGLAFTIVFPLIMFAAFELGWGVNYHGITERRAARIQNALERYYRRYERYPQALDQLVPGQLLAIPVPVIFKGEGWCYQGGETGYRLGAVYREFFSTPLSIRVYASSGGTPGEAWECDGRLAELDVRYGAVFTRQPGAGPAPAPQPTSQIPVPRMAAELHFQNDSLTPGTWSLDGKTWLFGFYTSAPEEEYPGLAFLNAGSGRICNPGVRISAEMDLRSLGAWLPDGRLLFVSTGGAARVLRPCEAGVETVDSLPSGIELTDARQPEGRWVLLNTAGTYWILDGNTLEAQPVEGVTPNPYELHWDQFAWSPDGNLLAIARLNGRDASQGSTLYLVSPGSGKVQAALPVKDASDQSAPWIEFLSEDELLLHGQGQLKLLDFSTSPPRIRDAMQELFSLDLHYPNEISAAGAFRLEGKAGYHLVLRANHPRNQAVYLYHSQNNQVEILHPDAHALLLMPDGEAVEMPRLEPFPEEGDIYELYRTGAAGREPTRLTVEGHLPRAYPGLSLHYLPRSSRLAFASQQGVSLVALPQGELLSFWELAGGSGINPSVFADPDEQALIVLADGVGLYWIPLGN